MHGACPSVSPKNTLALLNGLMQSTSFSGCIISFTGSSSRPSGNGRNNKIPSTFGSSFTSANARSKFSCEIVFGSSTTLQSIPTISIRFFALLSYARSSPLAPTRMIARHGWIPFPFNSSTSRISSSFMVFATSVPSITVLIAFSSVLTFKLDTDTGINSFFVCLPLSNKPVCSFIQFAGTFRVLH